jgi:hypothetical protein
MADGRISSDVGNELIAKAKEIIAMLKSKSGETEILTDRYGRATDLDQELVAESGLGAIYPNPFSESVVINYEVAADDPGIAKVLIRIYDMSGKMVGTLVNMNMQPGRYTVTWNGRDMNGEQAPHGTYIVHFKAGATEEVKEVVLVK